MQTTKLVQQFLIVILAGSLGACVAPTEKTIPFAQLPAAARQTLRQYGAEADIGEIVLGDYEGRQVFEVSLTSRGQQCDVWVTAEGVAVCVGKEVPLAEVPPAVMATIRQAAGGGVIELVEFVTEGKQTYYEADVTQGKKDLEIDVATDGALIGVEDVTD